MMDSNFLFQNKEISDFKSILIATALNLNDQAKYLESIIKNILQMFVVTSTKLKPDTFNPKTQWDKNRMYFLDDFVVC